MMNTADAARLASALATVASFDDRREALSPVLSVSDADVLDAALSSRSLPVWGIDTLAPADGGPGVVLRIRV